MSSLPAFLAVAAVVIVTPGPDTALTVRNTLVGGRTPGISTGVGVAAGQLLWALAASGGLASLLAASEPAFRALRLAGAAYLVYLGVGAFARALRGLAGLDPRTSARGPAESRAPRVAFRQGLVSNVTNPKMAVFFSSLLPQFAPSGEASFLGLLFLGVVFSAMTLAWLAAYAAAVAKAGDFLRGPRLRRLLEGCTGAVLVALDLRLATSRGAP